MEVNTSTRVDTLYWNVRMLAGSEIFVALKKYVVLEAAESATSQEGWDFLSYTKGYPMSLNDSFDEMCGEKDGIVNSCVEDCLEHVNMTVLQSKLTDGSDPRFSELLLKELGWAISKEDFVELTVKEISNDPTKLMSRRDKAQEDFLRLRATRPRHMYQTQIGPKDNTILVDYIRGAIEEIPLQLRDKPFFLLLKFGDASIRDTLGRLLALYGISDEQFANIDGPQHRLRIRSGNPYDVPFGFGIVDVCRSSSLPVDVVGLYDSLQFLVKFLNGEMTSRLMLVLPCFKDVDVEGVLVELHRFMNHLAESCGHLTNITIVTQNPETATRIRCVLLHGEVFNESAIDSFKKLAIDRAKDWLSSYELEASYMRLLDLAGKGSQDSLEYHCALASGMRAFIQNYVECFLLKEFDIQSDLSGKAVSIMSGHVATRILNKYSRCQSNRTDASKLVAVAEHILFMNRMYINPAMHLKSSQDSLVRMQQDLKRVIDRLLALVEGSITWRSSKEVDQEPGLPATPPPRPATPPRPSPPGRPRCFHFLHGGCLFGSRCRKAHVTSEGYDREDCKFNRKGRCYHGDQCRYMHRR